MTRSGKRYHSAQNVIARYTRGNSQNAVFWQTYFLLRVNAMALRLYIPFRVGVDSPLLALAASLRNGFRISASIANNARKGHVRLRIIIVRERKGLRTCGFRSEHCVFE